MNDIMQNMKNVEEILKDYDGWLKHQARIISPSGDQVEDLVQEGRIAMWQALDKYDPSRGSLSSYLVTVAYFRMGKVLKKNNWTGSSRASTNHVVKVGEPYSNLEELSGMVAYLPDNIELAYHHKEIQKSIEELSPKQQEYAVGKFWNGTKQRELPSHGVWDGHGKETLKNKLKHLEGIV